MLALITCLSSGAQTYMPGTYNNMKAATWTQLPDYKQTGENGLSSQKWFFSKYVAVSAGSAFYPGGSATFIMAPVGLQLNRQLSPNLYAYTGLYAAPTFASFRNSFMTPLNKPYPGNLQNQYSFGINPGIQMEMMYVNDAGTFSISGGISVQRNSYLYYPPATNNTRKH
jgi:hypothetical protein